MADIADFDLLVPIEEIQDITNSPLEKPLALSIAVIATDTVRDFCGWRIATPATETITVDGTGAGELFLPTMHIGNVDSVRLRDAEEDLDVDGYDWATHGTLDRLTGRWPRRRRAVSVTLTHGYAKCPGGIVQALQGAISRGTLAPAGGVTNESTLSAAVSYSRASAGGPAAGLMFLPHELAFLEAHRIPR
ncbi:hypothetical protein C5E10_18060 [Pseudoclavibacter sp. RFBG4]|uniref:hypothetical protein n=1 Tax=Pseudoclavibacter sp. RFBG4 TaxID=2080575 RepID=UPI000CE8EDD8|nr:hypothetical protein [Pseudoclavibacter sp. RFBG4]PPG25975.1 hypothetical protein C5E10_18060 [Pseudoclavibacter sp. RFBG4]